MFFDDDTGEIIENPDPMGGLWIVDRKGGNKKVNIPPDDMAVQCGECLRELLSIKLLSTLSILTFFLLEIISGGLLVATPHCVRASRAPKGKRVGRGNLRLLLFDINR